ncbi:unnamed protein product [Lymnaea stagnalis]|uniref:Protein O-linked-mannose beta-1,4-N-acetylglucosaminyltransferase 2 n=1 Tax=Lymnaea stagnalis TaxID=6523 RepID=A0AAV2IGX5_LYMST
MPSVHTVIHLLMLVLVAVLGTMYIQLQAQYLEMADSCNNMLRIPKSTHPRNSANVLPTASMDMHGTKNHLLESINKFNLESSSLFLHLDDKDILTGTELQMNTSFIFSISQSSFESSSITFKTTEKIALSESGKIKDKEISIAEQFVGASATEVRKTPETYSVDITNSAQIELLTYKESSQPSDSEISESQQFSKDILSFQPSTKADKPANKLGSYEHSHFLDHKDTSTNSFSSVESYNDLLETWFDLKSLAVSQTSRDLKPSFTQSVSVGANDRNFLETNVDDFTEEDVILSTENIQDDIKPFCHTDNCENINERSFNLPSIEPMHIEDDLDNEPLVKHMFVKELENNNQQNEPYSNIFEVNLDKITDIKELSNLISYGTSAWCQLNSFGTRSCRFHNLCYKVKEDDFIFLKGDKSVINMSPKDDNADFSEVFAINLSTVPDHNAHMFSMVTIPAESLHKFSIAKIDKVAVIMSRFKPDNIMHVLHDDIIPLFDTLYYLNPQHLGKKFDVALVFSDNHDNKDFSQIYSTLSSFPPITLRKLNYSSDVICFSDVYVGLAGSTLWYQYGFFEPQGPLPVNGSDVLLKVRRSANYLAEHFHTKCLLCNSGNYLVILSRKDNRLILNEGELIMAMAKATKLKVMSVSLETHSLGEIISIIKYSRGIIGMHGSLLSLVIFLQPGSVVLELFPFAINASKYTPFKTFCELPGSGIVYRSWTNPYKQKSVAHPEWPPEMGGIHHLPDNVQDKIVHEQVVNDHLCCEDASWLYHIYQDTEVDLNAVISITVDAFAVSEKNTIRSEQKSNSKFLLAPGPVKNLACKQNTTTNVYIYELSWQLPWNLEFLDHKHLESHLVFQESGDNETTDVILQNDQVSYSIQSLDRDAEYNVWVKVVIDHNVGGPFTYTACRSSKLRR